MLLLPLEKSFMQHSLQKLQCLLLTLSLGQHCQEIRLCPSSTSPTPLIGCLEQLAMPSAPPIWNFAPGKAKNDFGAIALALPDAPAAEPGSQGVSEFEGLWRRVRP